MNFGLVNCQKTVEDFILSGKVWPGRLTQRRFLFALMGV